MAFGSDADILHGPLAVSASAKLGSASARDSASARAARFDRLVDDHYAFVWRSARRLGVREADLDDAAQEVFLLAAKNLDMIVEERGYLFRTCAFVAANARRAARRRREVMDEQSIREQADRSARPDESAETNEVREYLQSLLDRMPDELREVFVLYELERFTTFELADALNLPTGTAASRLRRARELFTTLGLRDKRKGDFR